METKEPNVVERKNENEAVVNHKEKSEMENVSAKPPVKEDSLERSRLQESIDSKCGEEEEEAKKEEKNKRPQRKRQRPRKKRLFQRLRTQMEFYFSDANLSRDKALRKMLGDNITNPIPISEFMKFNKIKQLTADLQDLTKSIEQSSLITLSSDRTTVRRTRTIEHKPDADDCTVYVENLPAGVTREWLMDVFGHYGKVVYVALPMNKRAGKPKGCAFVEYDTKDMAKNALGAFGASGCTFPGNYVEDTAQKNEGDFEKPEPFEETEKQLEFMETEGDEDGVTKMESEEKSHQQTEDGVTKMETEEKSHQQTEDGVTKMETEEKFHEQRKDGVTKMETEEKSHEQIKDGVTKMESGEGKSQEEIADVVTKVESEGKSQDEMKDGVTKVESEGKSQDEMKDVVTKVESEGKSRDEMKDGVTKVESEGKSQEKIEAVTSGKRKSEDEEIDKKRLKVSKDNENETNAENAKETQERGEEEADKKELKMLGEENNEDNGETSKERQKEGQQETGNKRLKVSEDIDNENKAETSKEGVGEESKCKEDSEKRKQEEEGNTKEETTKKMKKEEEVNKDGSKVPVSGNVAVSSEGTKKKTKRKRKRKKSVKNYNEVEALGLQVMSKAEWKRLRDRYLELQRCNMINLKASIKRAQLIPAISGNVQGKPTDATTGKPPTQKKGDVADATAQQGLPVNPLKKQGRKRRRRKGRNRLMGKAIDIITQLANAS